MSEIKPGDLVNVINQDGELDGPFIFLEGPIKPEDSCWFAYYDKATQDTPHLSFKKSFWHYLVMNNDSPKWLECGFSTLIKLEEKNAEKS
jgi:hypothetical protein